LKQQNWPQFIFMTKSHIYHWKIT